MNIVKYDGQGITKFYLIAKAGDIDLMIGASS